MMRSHDLNDEVAIHYYGDASNWCAESSNPCESVCLGESSGQFYGHGETMLEAVQSLHNQLRQNLGIS